MKHRTRRPWHHFGIAVLAMLVFVQSVVAVLPNPDSAMGQSAVVAVMGTTSIPCDHGSGPCCDDKAPDGVPCKEMTSCAGSGCTLRAVATLPVLSLLAISAQGVDVSLPADAAAWLLTRHDTPLLRPPIPA